MGVRSPRRLLLSCGTAARSFRSAGTSGQLAPPGSTAQVKGPRSNGTPALLVAREVSFLAEAHFEEQQEQGARQAARYQNDGEDFAGHARDQRGAGGACDDQRGGGAKCEEAQPGTHGSTLHAQAPGTRSRRWVPMPGAGDLRAAAFAGHDRMAGRASACPVRLFGLARPCRTRRSPSSSRPSPTCRSAWPAPRCRRAPRPRPPSG
jgi:hypothetical protein